MTDVANDFADICTFCSEVKGDEDLNLFLELGISRPEYILHETEHWVVFPCIGALAKWYVPQYPQGFDQSGGPQVSATFRNY